MHVYDRRTTTKNQDPFVCSNGQAWSQMPVPGNPEYLEDTSIMPDGEDLFIEPSKPLYSFVSLGKFYQRPDGVIVVTELPIGRWPLHYLRWLEKLREDKQIDAVRQCCDDNKIYFEIYGFKEKATHKSLRLQRARGMSNILFLDENNSPVKYTSVADVMEAFYVERLAVYERRKEYILNELRRIIQVDNDKIRFILAVIEKRLDVMNRPMAEILGNMDILNIPRDVYKKVKIRNCNQEEVNALQQQIITRQADHDRLFAQSAQQTWSAELEQLEARYVQNYGPEDIGTVAKQGRPDFKLVNPTDIIVPAHLTAQMQSLSLVQTYI